MNDQLECFKKKIFEILNLKNTKNIIKIIICNYPRSKNRGPCNKYHIPQLLEYNELDDSNQYKKIKLDKNIKVKSNNYIFKIFQKKYIQKI